jgi:hypothetical protein
MKISIDVHITGTIEIESSDSESSQRRDSAPPPAQEYSVEGFSPLPEPAGELSAAPLQAGPEKSAAASGDSSPLVNPCAHRTALLDAVSAEEEQLADAHGEDSNNDQSDSSGTENGNNVKKEQEESPKKKAKTTP